MIQTPPLQLMQQQYPPITRPNQTTITLGCKGAQDGPCILFLNQTESPCSCNNCYQSPIHEYYYCKTHKTVMCCDCKDKEEEEQQHEQLSRQSDDEYKSPEYSTDTDVTCSTQHTDNTDKGTRKRKEDFGDNRQRKRRKENNKESIFTDINTYLQKKINIFINDNDAKHALEIVELKARVSSLQNDNKRAVNKASRKHKELIQLQCDLKQKEKHIAQQEKNVRGLSETNNGLQQTINKLENELNQLKETCNLEKKENEREIHKLSMSSLDADRQEWETKISLLENEINNNKSLKDDLDKKIEECNVKDNKIKCKDEMLQQEIAKNAKLEASMFKKDQENKKYMEWMMPLYQHMQQKLCNNL